MNKIKIVIAHIEKEKDFANAIKVLLENNLTNIDVIPTSDNINNIKKLSNTLDGANMVLILSSIGSFESPFISFTAGTSYYRSKVNVVCHSMMDKESLPVPLRYLDVIKISDKSQWESIITTLSKEADISPNNVGLDEFINNITKLENDYSFWYRCNDKFAKLNVFFSKLSPILMNTIKEYAVVKFPLPEKYLDNMERAISFFRENKILDYKKLEGEKKTPMGIIFDCELMQMDNFKSTMEDERFNFDKLSEVPEVYTQQRQPRKK